MPYEAKAARLVVCERTGRWAVALRRELTGVGLRVWETRTLADCGELLAESPASFVVLELRQQKPEGINRLIDRAGRGCGAVSQLEETMDFLLKWQAEFPLFRFSIVADRGVAPYRWFLQEAGATDFLCSVRRIVTLAQMACRHLAQVPPLPQSLTERIWANLPWSGAT